MWMHGGVADHSEVIVLCCARLANSTTLIHVDATFAALFHDEFCGVLP